MNLKAIGAALANIAGTVAGIGPMFGANPKAAAAVTAVTGDIAAIGDVLTMLESTGNTLSDKGIPGRTRRVPLVRSSRQSSCGRWTSPTRSSTTTRRRNSSRRAAALPGALPTRSTVSRRSRN